MRKLVLTGMLLATCAVQVGCFVPIWSSNQDVRAKQLINASESMRHIPEIWERVWGLDAPDFATPYRVHGGVI
jgi:hypothetical protein